jgi:hypothetical protein
MGVFSDRCLTLSWLWVWSQLKFINYSDCEYVDGNQIQIQNIKVNESKICWKKSCYRTQKLVIVTTNPCNWTHFLGHLNSVRLLTNYSCRFQYNISLQCKQIFEDSRGGRISQTNPGFLIDLLQSGFWYKSSVCISYFTHACWKSRRSHASCFNNLFT